MFLNTSWLRKRAAVCRVSLVLVAGWARAESVDASLVGNESALAVASTGVQLSTGSNETAGVVFPSIPVPDGADAVWVDCEVGGLAARGLTLAALNGASGETVGYWQNTSPLEGPVRLSAVLPLAAGVETFRLFAGSHRGPCDGRFQVLDRRPVRRGVAVRNMIYGAIIGPPEGRTPRQVFAATGRSIAGVQVLIRPADHPKPRPDLRVRLYRWAEDLAATLAGEVLAETVIPWRVIAVEWKSESIADEQIDATYEGGIRRLAVPLAADTEVGARYLLELAAVGPGAEERCYISYGWVDSYPDGWMFDGTRQTDWDLWLEVYDETW